MAIESKNLLVALKSYARANALPLDASEVYDSREEAEAYIKQANAYPGQTIKVLEDGKYVSYIIQPGEDGFYLDPLRGIDEETVQTKPFEDWLKESDEVYPAGTILVYTDRTTVDGVPVPDIKIANGVSTVEELPFLTDNNIEQFLNNNNISISDGTISSKTFEGAMSHKLIIGEYVYDGSEDIVIPVYNGESVID